IAWLLFSGAQAASDPVLHSVLQTAEQRMIYGAEFPSLKSTLHNVFDPQIFNSEPMPLPGASIRLGPLTCKRITHQNDLIQTNYSRILSLNSTLSDAMTVAWATSIAVMPPSIPGLEAAVDFSTELSSSVQNSKYRRLEKKYVLVGECELNTKQLRYVDLSSEFKNELEKLVEKIDSFPSLIYNADTVEQFFQKFGHIFVSKMQYGVDQGSQSHEVIVEQIRDRKGKAQGVRFGGGVSPVNNAQVEMRRETQVTWENDRHMESKAIQQPIMGQERAELLPRLERPLDELEYPRAMTLLSLVRDICESSRQSDMPDYESHQYTSILQAIDYVEGYMALDLPAKFRLSVADPKLGKYVLTMHRFQPSDSTRRHPLGSTISVKAHARKVNSFNVERGSRWSVSEAKKEYPVFTPPQPMEIQLEKHDLFDLGQLVYPRGFQHAYLASSDPVSGSDGGMEAFFPVQVHRNGGVRQGFRKWYLEPCGNGPNGHPKVKIRNHAYPYKVLALDFKHKRGMGTYYLGMANEAECNNQTGEGDVGRQRCISEWNLEAVSTRS
ncbi:MAG: hypothetical protein OXT67_12550, partial [Zetaproteobacteria bacterium]|nr:hypothetical protein [Zetaproteobacteria bacterium]